jgi:hypothetical protein
MSACEQARAEWYLAQAELERIDYEIYVIQKSYTRINTLPPEDGITERDLEHKKQHLVYQAAAMVEERIRWTKVKDKAEQAFQRELENSVHEWHSKLIYHQHRIRHARSIEERTLAAAQLERVEAQFSQAQQELARLGQDARLAYTEHTIRAGSIAP